MKKSLALLLVLAMSALACAADDSKDEKDNSKAEDRIQAAATVLDEIEAAPDTGIPEEVLASAECVAVVPSMLKGGFILAANYGRGVASCRTEKGWSAPAFLFTSGGSIGFQVGGQAIDLIMLVMNKDGMRNLLSSKFKLGADASVAAGPVGRHAAADTDWKLKAQVLTYSRTRGVFAGISLDGAVIKQDKDATRQFYGRMVPFRTSLTGKVEAPSAAFPFLNVVAKWAQKAADRDKSAEAVRPGGTSKPAEAPKPAESATPSAAIKRDEAPKAGVSPNP
ncbi:MAG TPA: lipid-binding SYLF domain-containing protein [Terriglobales bacterium]|nr:lipid-binding SYLF domain-containing protein [Terriglobales bacterium]